MTKQKKITKDTFTMKSLSAFIIALLAICSPIHSQNSLGAGETFTFEFSTLPFQRIDYSGLSTPNGQWGMAPPNLASLPVFRLEMFENSPNEAPIASRLYDPILLDNVSVIGNLTPNAWQDLQGAFRITMLSGSAQFGQIFIGAQVPGANGGLEYYGMVLTQIPEPSAIKVLAIGGLCVGLGFWMKRRRSYVVASMCCI